jgi:uncharacterized protein YidB (DUF937 family)
MGLLDKVIGAAAGGLGGGSAGGMGAGGGFSPSALQGVIGLLNNPQVGGIQGLLRLFQSNGLGQVANGWVSQGPNPPVSPGQLSQVFGQQRMSEFASQLGVPQDQAAQHLSHMLPQVVDHMTPDGTVPTQQHGPSDMFDMLKSKFLGG